jgi:hypothetical protein
MPKTNTASKATPTPSTSPSTNMIRQRYVNLL